MSDNIKSLLALDDATLATKLGFSDKVKAFRHDLERADKLSGTARTTVEDHVAKMFSPATYQVEDLGWKVDSAERKAKGKTTPSEIASCCCDVD